MRIEIILAIVLPAVAVIAIVIGVIVFYKKKGNKRSLCPKCKKSLYGAQYKVETTSPFTKLGSTCAVIYLEFTCPHCKEDGEYKQECVLITGLDDPIGYETKKLINSYFYNEKTRNK